MDPNNTISSTQSCYPFSTVWLYKDDLYTACIIACIVEVIFLIPITVENLLVIVGICKTRSLHSPANFLICALAFSDLLVGMLALPFHLAWKAFLLNGSYSEWCISIRIAYGVGVLLAAVSLLTITAISVERTVALYMAFRYEIVATNNKVFLFTLITWVTMVLLSLIQYYDLQSYRIAAAVIVFVCFCGSSFCCFKIYQVVRHHRTQIDIQENASEYYSTNIPSSKENRKTTMKEKKRSSASMLVLYGLFLLCYTPYIGVQIALLVGVENFMVHASEILTVSIVFVNSVLNPLLYCWRMRDIRRAMVSVIPCTLKRMPDIVINSRSYNDRNRTNNLRRQTRMSVSVLDRDVIPYLNESTVK